MTPQQQAEIDRKAKIAESKARIADPDNDLLKTIDVARMVHRSEAAIHKMKGSKQIPKYAMPKKLHASQRGYFWSKKAIHRWIAEMMGAA